MIALAHNDGLLQELVVKWEPNLSKLVQSSIPKAAGRKPGPRRNCLSRAHEHRDVGQLEDPLKMLLLLKNQSLNIFGGLEAQR